MNKNELVSISYVNPYNDSPWVCFNRVYNTRYYDLKTYEREDVITRIFNKYCPDSDRLEFSFHGNKTIITFDI